MSMTGHIRFAFGASRTGSVGVGDIFFHKSQPRTYSWVEGAGLREPVERSARGGTVKSACTYIPPPFTHILFGNCRKTSVRREPVGQ